MKINEITIEAALNAPLSNQSSVRDCIDRNVTDRGPGPGVTPEDVMRAALSAAQAASDLQRERYIHRDAVSGLIVSADYAAEHPDTTVRERV